MSNWVDYHIHTKFSDGKNVYQEYIEQALKIGATEIGFSDHITLHEVDWRTNPKDYHLLKTQLSEICAQTHPNLNIKFGLEVDYFPHEEEAIQQLINQFPVDYVIGSVHFIDDWNFDSDKSMYGKIDNDTLYQKYYALVQLAAKSQLFDIIGHIDLIKKFQCYPETNQDHLIAETLDVLKENKVAFELNTSGKNKPCNEFYPSEEILKMAFEKNIPITLGSDAHKIENLNRYFPQAIQLLKEIGYQKLVKFNHRIPTFINL